MLMFLLQVALRNWNLLPLKLTLAKSVNAIRKVFVAKRVFHELKKGVDKLDL